MREFHTIVEYSYNIKKSTYIIRFLDGTCLKCPIEHLPSKYQIKSAKWEQAELSTDKTALSVKAGRKKIEVPAYALYAAGRIL